MPACRVFSVAGGTSASVQEEPQATMAASPAGGFEGGHPAPATLENGRATSPVRSIYAIRDSQQAWTTVVDWGTFQYAPSSGSGTPRCPIPTGPSSAYGSMRAFRKSCPCRLLLDRDERKDRQQLALEFTPCYARSVL